MTDGNILIGQLWTCLICIWLTCDDESSIGDVYVVSMPEWPDHKKGRGKKYYHQTRVIHFVGTTFQKFRSISDVSATFEFRDFRACYILKVVQFLLQLVRRDITMPLLLVSKSQMFFDAIKSYF